MTAAADLHGDSDGLSLGQYLGEVLGAENVAQRGLREQAGRVVRVLDPVLPRGGSV